MSSLPDSAAVDGIDGAYSTKLEPHAGTPRLDQQGLTSAYEGAHKRLFMFDYDGTLTPIVQDPAAAVPTSTVTQTVERLAADPRNTVWIISGRDQDFLQRYMGGIAELGLSAEHGSFIREPRSSQWVNLADNADMDWQNEVMRIFGLYTERTQGSFIERKRMTVTWHYRGADPELGASQAHECRQSLEAEVAGRWDVNVMAGKANLEVRPSFINKGEIAKRLVLHDQKDPPDFVLCMGDDFTDEDMFRALQAVTSPATSNSSEKKSIISKNQLFTVTVGPASKTTWADWHLPEPSDVVGTIGQLSEMATASSSSSNL